MVDAPKHPPNKSITIPLDEETLLAIERVKKATGVRATLEAIRVALGFTASSYPRAERGLSDEEFVRMSSYIRDAFAKASDAARVNR